MQAIELEMAPRLSAHANAIYLNAKLFARLDAVWRRRAALNLDPESRRPCWSASIWISCARAPDCRPKRACGWMPINQRLATLSTEFSQNVLADEEDYVEPLSETQIAGASDALRGALAATAKERGLDAPYAVTLSRSSIEPFLQAAADRAVREKLFKAWVRRGGNEGAHDNSAIMAETLSLRAEKAALLGYENYAAYKLADSMAGTPARARALLDKVWAPARRRALEERDALQALVAEEGGNFALARLGLALLCRETAPAALRFRRCGVEALSQRWTM